MLYPENLITFTDPDGKKSLEFDFVNEIEIQKSRKSLTRTCKIKIPRKIIVLNGDINSIMKRGSKVAVKLGYGNEMRTEFTGYIARVGAGVPVEIFCEDEMWILKQNSFTKAWKKVSLKEVVSYVYPGISRVADLQLGTFVIKEQSTAQVLDALKKFSLQCYFDVDGVLVADFSGSTMLQANRVVYDFNINVIDPNLEYKRKEDIRIRVKGISKQASGKNIEAFFGDKDGDLRTLNYVNMDKKDLEKIIKQEIDKLKQDGYKGAFKTFGLPYCEPGYIASMIDNEYPERDGSYLVESVNTIFGVDGFRRDINLERKLA